MMSTLRRGYVFVEIFHRASCEKNHFFSSHECQNVTSLGLFPGILVFHDPQVINNTKVISNESMDLDDPQLFKDPKVFINMEVGTFHTISMYISNNPN